MANFYKKLSLLSLLAAASVILQAQESVEVTLVSSKDIQLRMNSSNQNPYGASMELREEIAGDKDGSGIDIRDYGFCGLIGFDLAEIYNRIADGYKVKNVQLKLTNSDVSGKTVLVKPFMNDWEESSETTYALMESQIKSAADEENILSIQLPNVSGKKPFELGNAQAVEHYDIYGYQGTFSSENLLNYVANAIAEHQTGLSFLLTGNENTRNSVYLFTKDATRANYGTSGKTDQYTWNGVAWVNTGIEIPRYDAMLSYFGLEESEFVQIVAPKLIVTLEKSGVNVATSLVEKTDVTSANSIGYNVGTCIFEDNAGQRTENIYYYSSADNSTLYLGRYNMKLLQKIKANIAFEPSGSKYVALNFATMDAPEEAITADYVSANNGTIRDANHNMLSIRGKQLVGASSLWNSGFKIGADYEVDIQTKRITVDENAFKAYWVAQGDAIATTYSEKSDGSTSESSFNKRYDSAISSDNLQDLYIYATAGGGRVGVYSVTLYFADNSSVTVPVTAMNGYEITPQNLSADLILSSSEIDGTPISSVTLGTTAMNSETAGLLLELQRHGISSTADQVNYTMTVGTAEAATLVLPYDATLPDGVKAYTLSYTSGNEAQAVEVNAITANQPVLINAMSGNYNFQAANAILTFTDHPENSGLTGTYETIQVPAETYILQNKADEGVAFYQVNTNSNIMLSPFRAYLNAALAGVNKLLINFGETTGVLSITEENSDNGPVYNLQGVKVADSVSDLHHLPKGIYLIKGKKISVK